jgi:hypothetical protein
MSEAVNGSPQLSAAVSPVQCYVFAKQLNSRTYWRQTTVASEKHMAYQQLHTCFLLGCFFYWMETLRSVSFSRGLAATSARNFELKRGAVSRAFATVRPAELRRSCGL